MKFDNVDDLFKDLDEREYEFFARALSTYRDSLMKRGFTRREAMRLVEAYSRFIYNLSIEEFVAQKTRELDEELDKDIKDDDEDVDIDDDSEL